MSKIDSLQSEISEIGKKLEQGISEIIQGENFKNWLDMQAKFPNYSFQNSLLIGLQNPDATYVCGFQKWKKEFERNVIKGEKGLKILAPCEYKQNVMRNVLDENGQTVINEDGTIQQERVEIKRISFRPVTVFDVSQTEGKELPKHIVPTLTQNVDEFEKMKDALHSISPVPIQYETIEGGVKGYFSPLEQKIVIKDNLSELQEVKTLAHEIAHSLAHDKNNKRIEDLTETESRSVKELEAEACAYVFCQHFGLDTSDYSLNYIAGWGKEPSVELLKNSMDNISKISSKMIIAAEERVLQKNQEINLEKTNENNMEKEEKKQSVKKNISIGFDR